MATQNEDENKEIWPQGVHQSNQKKYATQTVLKRKLIPVQQTTTESVGESLEQHEEATSEGIPWLPLEQHETMSSGREQPPEQKIESSDKKSSPKLLSEIPALPSNDPLDDTHTQPKMSNYEIGVDRENEERFDHHVLLFNSKSKTIKTLGIAREEKLSGFCIFNWTGILCLIVIAVPLAIAIALAILIIYICIKGHG